MSMLGTGQSLTDTIASAIGDAIPGASVEVHGSGGHFTIKVVSAEFEGKSLLAKQRMVLSAVAPFMEGADAPVHAIDHLETSIP